MSERLSGYCKRCRRRPWQGVWSHGVRHAPYQELTGRGRNIPRSRRWKVEFRCGCGKVGWSRHEQIVGLWRFRQLRDGVNIHSGMTPYWPGRSGEGWERHEGYG